MLGKDQEMLGQGGRNHGLRDLTQGHKKRKIATLITIFLLVSGLLDSNQRPRAPQTCALPTALNPVPFCECKGTAIISIHQTIVQLFYSFDIIKHIIDITSR